MIEINGIPQTIYAYDVEVFPNFFSAIFKSEDGSVLRTFYKFEDQDDIPELLEFLAQPNLLLVGYNSAGYDDIVLKAIIKYYSPAFSNKNIHNISKMIIEERGNWSKELKEVYKSETPWESADMMAMLKMNMNTPSLKHCAIHLEHHRLQDLPKKPTSRVRKSEVPLILEYNENDVDITLKLWHDKNIQEAVQLRIGLGAHYGVDLLSADDSKIGNIILDAEYGVPDRRASYRKIIRGTDLIPPTLVFETEEMLAVQRAIEELVLVETETKKGNKTHLTYPKRKKFEYIFEFDGTKYKMAKGGLHSDDQPRILRSTDKLKYRDADVASYYPWLRQRYGLVPGHLDKKRFLEVDLGIIERRIAGKKAGDKVIADGLKICINGIFGKYNYEHYWLYDPLCFYRTTIYGQLFLLMLIEMLHLRGIRTVSANTDGIVCEISAENEEAYYQTCKEWEQRTGLDLEYTDYDFLVTLNVNSYMGVMTNGKIKTKKDFADNKKLSKQTFIKGYNAPVVALALQEYFQNGTSPDTFVMEHENIHNFLFTQKTGGKFELFWRWPNGKEEKLQKTNRYYVTDIGPVLVKKDKTSYNYGMGRSKVSRETAIWKGHSTHILNDISDERPAINRNAYINKVQEIIDKIEPPEVLSIFDFV